MNLSSATGDVVKSSALLRTIVSTIHCTYIGLLADLPRSSTRSLYPFASRFCFSRSISKPRLAVCCPRPTQ